MHNLITGYVKPKLFILQNKNVLYIQVSKIPRGTMFVILARGYDILPGRFYKEALRGLLHGVSLS